MRSALAFSLLALCACGEPPVLPDAASSSQHGPVAAHDMNASMAHVASTIEQMSDEQRADASQSLAFLAANCPYTRAALQLPFVLQQAVMDIDPDSLDDAADSDWTALQSGLALHIAVLDALDVQLPLPGPNDFLSSAVGLTPDRATLMASPHQLSMTQSLVRAIPALAEQTSPETRSLIEAHSTRVETATGVIRQCPRGPWSVMPGHPWTLGEQLGAHHDSLERVLPMANSGQTSEQISVLIALLDSYEAATHAHVGTL